MKFPVKADNFAQAIAHLRECGFEKISGFKRVRGEYIFRVVIGGDL